MSDDRNARFWLPDGEFRDPARRLQAFDALPPEVRRLLANCAVDYCPGDAIQRVRKFGLRVIAADVDYSFTGGGIMGARIPLHPDDAAALTRPE